MPSIRSIVFFACAIPVAFATTDPTPGDTRARVDELLGDPTLVRYGADGLDTAKYDRGIVTFRRGLVTTTDLEPAEVVAARLEKKLAEERRLAFEAEARIAESRRADQDACEVLLASPKFRTAPPAERLAALEKFLAAHPYADAEELRKKIAALRTALAKGTRRAPRPSVNAPPFGDVVRGNFASWDLDRDGRLQPEETDRLMLDTGIVGDAAAALATIKGMQLRVGMRRDGYFAPTVGELAKPGLTITNRVRESPPYPAQARFLYHRKAISMIESALFAEGAPSFAKLRQGNAGNCCLYAAVGCLAKADPERLHSMVMENEDGDYVVRLGTGEAILVSKRSEARLIHNVGVLTLSDGVWFSVIEEAVSRRLVKYYGGNAPADATLASISGPSISELIRLFGGKKVTMYVLRHAFAGGATRTSLARDLKQALAAKRIIVAGMPEDPPAGFAKIPGVGYSHAYAITGYDGRTGRVSLWNPWCVDFTPEGEDGVRNGYKTVNGEFSVPIAELHTQFGAVFIEPR